VIVYTHEAERLVADLLAFYLKRERPAAIAALRSALQEAERTILAAPARGLPSPSPYPSLAKPGRLWRKSGSYWIAYDPTALAILAVFHETANMPARLSNELS
jgi:plasmid stabilization system protein ParE